ncbi:MAG: hypothetical protein FWD94_01965 [Treponema sp.]|nr:hypothetical protein [Treponema sp.]
MKKEPDEASTQPEGNDGEVVSVHYPGRNNVPLPPGVRSISLRNPKGKDVEPVPGEFLELVIKHEDPDAEDEVVPIRYMGKTETKWPPHILELLRSKGKDDKEE